MRMETPTMELVPLEEEAPELSSCHLSKALWEDGHLQPGAEGSPESHGAAPDCGLVGSRAMVHKCLLFKLPIGDIMLQPPKLANTPCFDLKGLCLIFSVSFDYSSYGHHSMQYRSPQGPFQCLPE